MEVTSTLTRLLPIFSGEDKPCIVVECVDTDEKIQSVIPTIDEMMDGGLITLEKANVIIYRPENNR